MHVVSGILRTSIDRQQLTIEVGSATPLHSNPVFYSLSGHVHTVPTNMIVAGN